MEMDQSRMKNRKKKSGKKKNQNRLTEKKTANNA